MKTADNSRKPWSPEDIEELDKLRKRGESIEELIDALMKRAYSEKKK